MIYELEIFTNSGTGKTETVRAEGSGFIVMDSVDGALFCIVNTQGSPSLVIPFIRLCKMTKVLKHTKSAKVVKVKDKLNVQLA